MIPIIVIGGFLPYGIRRIGHDDADVLTIQALDAFGIFREHFAEKISFFAHLEGVRQTQAFERLVILSLHDAMVGFLNVHAGNVIGQQDNFTGKEFFPVFTGRSFLLIRPL